MDINQSHFCKSFKMIIVIFFLTVSASAPIYLTAQDDNRQDKKPISHKHDKLGEKCFICDPTLREKGRLWCKEHNRYEDRCWLCHPEQQEKDRAFCNEHNLYENECFLCKPELKEKKIMLEKKDLANINNQVLKCTAHNIDKTICYLCDTTLREKGRLWCKEHNRYEDRCWECHPDAKDSNRPFCEKHFLYLDECIFCNLTIKKKTNELNGVVQKNADVLMCKEHKVSEKECGICQPELASQLEPGQSMKIRFASKKSTQMAGIQTALPTEKSSAPTIEAFCQINYNENKLSHITPLVSGVVRQVFVDLGSQIDAGEVLIEIQSNEIAEAKSNYLSALVDYQIKEIVFKQEEILSSQKISSTREYQEAMATSKIAQLTKNTARQKLLNFGFTNKNIEEIEKTQDSSSSLGIKAPFKGTVLVRNAVEGEAVEFGKTLITIADLSTMWLELSIPADKIAVIEKGLVVEGVFDSLSGIKTRGEIIWVSSLIDDRSRMMKARANVPNINDKLKAGMIGEALIEIGNQTKTLRVPKNSIIYYEKKPFLFVKRDSDIYDLRSVMLGGKSNSEIDVISGIHPNDQVVVVGAFIVMSEFLKSRLGAGCVDD